MQKDWTLADFRAFREWLQGPEAAPFIRLNSIYHESHVRGAAYAIGHCYDCIAYYEEYYSLESTLQQGRSEKYPYNRWFDGIAHRLTQEEDFPDVRNVYTFRSAMYQVARKRGLKLATRILDEEDAVIIKATRPKKKRPHELIPGTPTKAPVETESEEVPVPEPTERIRVPRAMR